MHRPTQDEEVPFSERPRSKSSFKLVELNERYNFLKPGYRVLDLGAGRCGWSEVAVNCVESPPERPQVFSVDIKSSPCVPGATFIIADVREEDSHTTIMQALQGPVDVLLSDLSEEGTTDKDLDCVVACSLCIDALRIANLTLKPGGFMLIRMLSGMHEKEQFVRNT